MESRLGRTIPSLLKTYRKPAQGKPRCCRENPRKVWEHRDSPPKCARQLNVEQRESTVPFTDEVETRYDSSREPVLHLNR